MEVVFLYAPLAELVDALDLGPSLRVRVRVSQGVPSICECGGIGRHKRLKISRFGVRVRVPSLVPQFLTVIKTMSYNKELESNQEAKREHDKNMKANAAARLKKNAEWNKRNKQ